MHGCWRRAEVGPESGTDGVWLQAYTHAQAQAQAQAQPHGESLTPPRRRHPSLDPIEENHRLRRFDAVTIESEWDLIVRCRSGSAAAFEPLVRRHEPRGLAFAELLLGDADEAQDAVQEAFVKAYRSLHRLAEGSDFGAWFRSILRNQCLDRLRSIPRRRRVRLDEQAIDGRTWNEPVGSAALEQAQLARGVRSALDELSTEHREILVLKELEGMSYTDIAALTGIPPGTVASRLYHARSALRRIVTTRGITLSGSEA